MDDAPDNLVALALAQAERLGDRPFLHARHDPDGGGRCLSWRETMARAAAFARGLMAEGVEPGDRIALISENRPEWLIADLGIMMAGGITVPGYTTHTAEDFRYLLTDSGATAVITSGGRLA